MATSQDFVNWVCGKDIDYRFLKYVLLAEKETLLQYASGTTHQTIYFPEAKAFYVCLPPVDEQLRIASLLASIDEKIELNYRLADTADAMTRTLFKSWFVDFEPVHAKVEGRNLGLGHDIAAIFPTSMTDDLPTGWRSVALSHIGHFLNGLPLQKFTPEADQPWLPVIKIPELRSGPTVRSGRARANIPADYIVKEGDHLFSWSGTLIHSRWAYSPGALNQHLFKVTPVGVPDWLTFEAVRHHLPSFQAIAAGKAVTMGHIQRHHLDEAAVALPPEPTLRAMDRVFSPLFNRSLAAKLEIVTLASLRDTLLPRLVSGELRIPDLERALAAG